MSLTQSIRTNRLLAALLLLTLASALSCSGPLIRERALQQINDEWRGATFVPREDIHTLFPDRMSESPDLVFRQGSELRIWIEASSDWARVRAVRVDESQEQARGRTIVYLFRDDGVTREEVEEMVRSEVDRLLVHK